jgi:hypothetical protein
MPIAPDFFYEEHQGIHWYRFYITDNCWSGIGKQWSDWYYISSGPPPEGFRVVTATFLLDGDRGGAVGNEINTHPQTAWSEIKQIELTPHKVTWAFRLQGHDEAPTRLTNLIPPTFQSGGGQGITHGVLWVNFMPISVVPI